jgi:arylformamidase
MTRMIDLSGTLENGLWGYHELPGLEQRIPAVEVQAIAMVRDDGFFSSKIVCSTISGTYLESGSHMLEEGRNLDEYTVEDFMNPAKLVRIPNQEAKTLIDAQILKAHAPRIEKGDALIIDTGWSRMWNKPGYVLQCPNLLPAAIEWVAEKQISIFGVDIPCIEASWSEGDEEQKGSMLRSLFQSGTLLLAPLVNLQKISRNSGQLICLPLKVQGTSGAPARAVFIED